MADGINQLKRYWLHGEGATKIRWGSEGDYTRCVRQLDEHVGQSRARRICAQWHFEANGIWPGHHGGENKQGPG